MLIHTMSCKHYLGPSYRAVQFTFCQWNGDPVH